jgi:CRP/FNR family cyclic AMP-dependent transcriptional regulator
LRPAGGRCSASIRAGCHRGQHNRVLRIAAKLGYHSSNVFGRVKLMEQILVAAATLPVSVLGPRAVLVSEGARTGKLYILKSGDLEVLRDGTTVAAIGEPGSVIGDMSALLDLPHSATVRTRNGAEVHVADDADAFLDEHPAAARHIAKLLAARLQKTTALLVDMRKQAKVREDQVMFDKIFALLE